MAILVLKLALTPLLIAAATHVQRKRGGAAGGLLAGLPLISGPVSVILALEHGPAFAARSAVGTLLGLIGMSAFCTAYALCAKRHAWPLAFGVGCLACAALMLAASALPQNLALAAAVTFPALFASVRLAGPPLARVPPLRPAWWDTPARMFAAGLAAFLVTVSAAWLGPTWSGLLATLPVFGCVMGIFSHRHGGYPVAHDVLRGMAVGAFGSAAFYVALGALVEQVPMPLAYLAAIGFALGAAAASHARLTAPGLSARNRAGQP